MENAISYFFADEDALCSEARDWLTGLFATSDVDAEWHVKNFCRQLIATNPLHINSTTHGPFWDRFNRYASSAIKSYEKKGTTPQAGDFTVIVNNGEIVYTIGHIDALGAIIFTLASNALADSIISVYNIPEHILLAMLKRRELRSMFFQRFASRCEDQVDIYMFYNRGLISNDVLHSTLEEYTDENGEQCYMTPPPEEVESMEIDSLPVLIDVLKLNLPERVDTVELRRPNKMGIQYTLAFYSYLWSEVSKSVESVQYQCKILHGAECKCQLKILNMRVLLPLLSAYVGQTLDLRTIVRTDVRTFFTISEPLHTVLELVSKHISQYLSGAPACPDLDMFIYNHTRQAESMEQDVAKLWDGSARRVVTCRLAELPLELLLRELDSEYLFASALPKLRGFLANRDRSNHIAYLMPREVGMFDICTTLAIVCKKFGSTFPALRNIVPVWAKSGVYVVCKPGVMNIFRCLMLSERIVETSAHSSRSQCLGLPQCGLILRNCLMHANSFSQENAAAANLSLAVLLDHYLGSRDTNVDPVFSDGNINNTAILNLYSYIPTVCQILERECETEEDQFTTLRAFLHQTLRHVCDISLFNNFLSKLKNRVHEESPHRCIVDKLVASYARKRGTLSKTSRKNNVNISRRTDQEINHTSIYMLLLTTDVFDPAEVAEYLQAFRLEKTVSKPNQMRIKAPVAFSRFHRENSSEFDQRSRDAICEYWERQSFIDNADQHYQQLETHMCPVQLSTAAPLESRFYESHYEASRFGHTFRPLRREDEVGVCPNIAEIRSLCTLLSRLEFQHHSGLAQYSDPSIFDIIHSDKPLCLPLSLNPDIYFENAFFVYVGVEWPLPYNPSADILTTGGDLPLSGKRNLLDYVMENCSSWKASSRVTSGVNARYTDCIVALQKAHKPEST